MTEYPKAEPTPPATWAKHLSAFGERPLKVREAIKMIEKDDWYQVVMKGSHRQFKHPRKLGRVTIAGKMSDDLAPGTLNSILKQAGLKGEK